MVDYDKLLFALETTMLVSLTLDNLALIEKHDITFDERFNVITGETGAGKSLILDALSLCVGGRAESSLVRHGTQEANVFGEFDISNNPKAIEWFATHEHPLEENTILIRRKIHINGRSKSWINGVPVSISELKSLGVTLVSIHSQHSGLELLKPQFVVDWLDNMGNLYTLKQSTKHAFETYTTLKKDADDAKLLYAQRHDKIALLSAKLTDIEPLLSVNIANIESEYDELSNLESLMQNAMHTATILDSQDDTPSLSTLLSRAIKLCDTHADKAKIFGECSTLLTLAQEQIDDAYAKLTDYAEQSLPDEVRLAELNTLIDLAHRLSNKYRTPIGELIDSAHLWQQELDHLHSLPDNDTLDKQVAQAYDEYINFATKLNQARQAICQDICQQLVANLVPLALPNAQCQFQFTPKSATQYTVHGIYDIDLLFSANVGMPPQPLHKVASGGELSRIALVMQVMVANADDTQSHNRPTLVFDEVDVGISGGTAQVVGNLLRQLGTHQQLLAITHQAQVAAAAHRHILVSKEHNEQTTSKLCIISDNAQIDELARMSGGVIITDTTRAHAKSLLKDIMDK